MRSSPYCDDRGVKGFDAPGLTKYFIFKTTGIELYRAPQNHFDTAKRMGKLVSVHGLKKGDIVFFGKSQDNIKHEGIYVGNGRIIEAPPHDISCTNEFIRETPLDDKYLIELAARFC